MAYQFTQTGAEIQDILDQVGENTSDIAQNAQDISTLNSNLTNKFTSGTWTPTVTNAVLDSASGKWVKIGDVVFLSALLRFNATQTGTSGIYINMSSLPSVARSKYISGTGIARSMGITLSSNMSVNDNVFIFLVDTGNATATNSQIAGARLAFTLTAVPAP